MSQIDKTIKIFPGSPGGDCTAPYYIEYPKGMTVKQFISTFLKENPDEWGHIELRVLYNDIKPCCNYEHGKISSTWKMENYYDSVITEANGSGGWSRSDFILTVSLLE